MVALCQSSYRPISRGDSKWPGCFAKIVRARCFTCRGAVGITLFSCIIHDARAAEPRGGRSNGRAIEQTVYSGIPSGFHC